MVIGQITLVAIAAVQIGRTLKSARVFNANLAAVTLRRFHTGHTNGIQIVVVCIGVAIWQMAVFGCALCIALAGRLTNVSNTNIGTVAIRIAVTFDTIVFRTHGAIGVICTMGII
jgi:hypothetical protein